MVTSVLDSGVGSLRWAIQLANIDPLTADTIVFDIPGPDAVNLFVPLTPLPPITGPVVIDGYCGTCDGATENTNAIGSPSNAQIKMMLVGDVVGSGPGLHVMSPGVTIQGFSIVGFPDAGILVGTNGQGAVIRGNYLGVTTSGQFPFGNGTGLRVYDAQDVVVGGDDPGDRNVLSGNAQAGISANGATNLTVAGNYIGPAASGNTPLGNGDGGISVYNCKNVVIGGPAPAHRNVISGNGYLFGDGSGIDAVNVDNGQVLNNFIGTDRTGMIQMSNSGPGIRTDLGVDNLEIAGNTVSGNDTYGIDLRSGFASATAVVRDNRIGTNSAGTAAIANGAGGIHIQDFTAAVIGGTADGDGNLISGNGGPGIFVAANAHGTKVHRNIIGLDFNGGPQGNAGPGIQFEGVPAPTGATAGGSAELANLIAHNDGDGILAANGVALRFSANLIWGNGGQSIDLLGDGPTPNDPGDADGMANGLLNYPAVTSAQRTGLGTRIEYGVDTTPGTELEVQFFAGASCGDARYFLGSASVNSGPGSADFDATVKFAEAGSFVTALAIDASGNTSELGPCVEALPRPREDVNCDDTVDGADVIAALRKLAGYTDGTLPKVCLIDPITPAADADTDGIESIADVVRIQRVSAGLD